MYTLFAYTRDPAQRIVRFAVDNNVQKSLTDFLKPQVDFFNRDRESVPFDGKYKPDDGELLVIDEFEDLDNLASAIPTPLSIPIADPSNLSFDQIRALFIGETNADNSISVYIQNFDRRKLITDSGFSIFHSKDTYKKIEGTGLTVDTKISAKLTGTKLEFYSFFLVSRIFDMSSYFQEATDADIDEFAELPQISVADHSALIDISDSWIRKKFWLIRQSGILDRVAPADIKAIAAEFSIPVAFETIDGIEKLKLPDTKKELKAVLRFLDEDYYKSPLSKTNFITNSKRAVA